MKLPVTAPSCVKAAEENGRPDTCEGEEEQRALDQPPCREPEGRACRPDEDERRDEKRARRVSEPPEQPARAVRRGRRRIGEREHGDPVRRRDGRARHGAEEREAEDVPQAVEGEAKASAAQEVDRHYGF
jgi:hypothetical protein